MATDITMPKLSDTMTEGRLISWKKNVGDRVERGDVIAEVETDKANMELEAFTAGFLLETRAKSGDMVPVGTVIGIIGESGEKVAPVPGAVQQEEPHAPEPAAAKLKEEASPDKEQPSAGPPPKPHPEPPGEHAPAGAGEAPGVDLDLEAKGRARGEEPEPERASPMVRRLAREKGIDLKAVTGSGPDGRILREDLEKVAAPEKAKEKEPAPAPASPPPGGTLPLSRMRRAIARTVVEAWHTIPHFAVTVPVDMVAAESFYRSLKAAGKTLSVNDLVVKASALALARFTLVNATFTEQEIAVHADINIGIAVSLPEGLVVPVIRECQKLPLLEIAERSRALITNARNGTLTENDLSGGTFSISNLGMYGVEEFMAVIYPPQGAILAVGGISDEAAVKGGMVVPRRVMRMTLSADHRLVDGAYAAQFLAEVRRILENPALMLV